jgi:hypothetical protein
MRVQLCLTVWFDSPFWVGLFERTDERGYSISRVVFGAEPRDIEVHQYLLEHFAELRWSDPVADAEAEAERASRASKINPKRAQREARRALAMPAVSTRAQEALKLDIAQRKQKRQQRAAEDREEEARRKFELRQAKRKAKHRGH